MRAKSRDNHNTVQGLLAVSAPHFPKAADILRWTLCMPCLYEFHGFHIAIAVRDCTVCWPPVIQCQCALGRISADDAP
jgi:hypothetical protein